MNKYSKINFKPKTTIGYCVSCQNLFCEHPEIRKSQGECIEWSTPK